MDQMLQTERVGVLDGVAGARGVQADRAASGLLRPLMAPLHEITDYTRRYGLAALYGSVRVWVCVLCCAWCMPPCTDLCAYASPLHWQWPQMGAAKACVLLQLEGEAD